VPRGGTWTEAPARGSPSVLPHSQNGYGETNYEVVVHHFEDNRVEGAKELAIDTPGLLGPDDFRALATVVEALAASPPDPAALAEVMRRHGLTPAA